MKKAKKTNDSLNLIAMYQIEERITNKQLANILGESVGRACAARDMRQAPQKQVRVLAAFEGISVAEFFERYGNCA
ncbi:MAG: hypothetical protein K6C12_08750 [Oscillospiraceae bacterium]|nr:hypothetical protein [Oscillospiraceae bacterium]